MKNNNEIKLIDVLESYLGEKIMNYNIEFKDNNRIDIKVRPVKK